VCEKERAARATNEQVTEQFKLQSRQAEAGKAKGKAKPLTTKQRQSQANDAEQKA